jgi:hypothetical protein
VLDLGTTSPGGFPGISTNEFGRRPSAYALPTADRPAVDALSILRLLETGKVRRKISEKRIETVAAVPEPSPG